MASAGQRLGALAKEGRPSGSRWTSSAAPPTSVTRPAAQPLRPTCAAHLLIVPSVCQPVFRTKSLLWSLAAPALPVRSHVAFDPGPGKIIGSGPVIMLLAARLPCDCPFRAGPRVDCVAPLDSRPAING